MGCRGVVCSTKGSEIFAVPGLWGVSLAVSGFFVFREEEAQNMKQQKRWISFQLPEADAVKLERAAARNHRSRSGEVRRLILAGLAFCEDERREETAAA
jgi:hypothetical protein